MAAGWKALGNIEFDFDKADIRASERSKVDDIIKAAKDNPGFEIGLSGFTDPRGTPGYNQKLSERRVAAVKNAVVAGGVAADRIKTIAAGEHGRNCLDSTEGCFQRNRRVEVLTRASS